MTSTTLWGGWFGFYDHNGKQLVHPQSNRQLTAECIADCSGQGCVDEAVEFWVDRLNFDGPSWMFRRYLNQYGGWEASELADHNENRKRILWIWACQCWEGPGNNDYFWLGV